MTQPGGDEIFDDAYGAVGAAAMSRCGVPGKVSLCRMNGEDGTPWPEISVSTGLPALRRVLDDAGSAVCSVPEAKPAVTECSVPEAVRISY